MQSRTKSKYASVTQVNNYVNGMFNANRALHSVHMTGEISNYRPRYGHQYFTLKDDRSQIDAVIWQSVFQHVHFKLKNGMKVNVVCSVRTYVKRGTYQASIWHIEPAGIGQLYIHLKQIQQALRKDGLFNQEHKRPLTQFPKRIAVITSTSGAVIRDIIRTVRARYPIAQVVLYPADVQGANAVPSLVDRLNQVSTLDNCDEVIIGRGGGSLEDLWGFESAELAKAIYNCSIPVVSSVGHGTDITTADLVADKSAVTPTGAAEECTPVPLQDLLTTISDWYRQLYDACSEEINSKQEQVEQLMQSAVFTHPETIYSDKQQAVEYLYRELQQSIHNKISQADDRLANLKYLLRSNSPQQIVDNKIHQIDLYRTSLKHYMANIYRQKVFEYNRLITVLNQMNPYTVMDKGYSLVTMNGHTVKNADELHADDIVKLHLDNGTKLAKILEDKGND